MNPRKHVTEKPLDFRLALRLRRARLALGLSQRELAGMLNVSERTVWEIEHHRYHPYGSRPRRETVHKEIERFLRAYTNANV